jgi:hypothetical protein
MPTTVFVSRYPHVMCVVCCVRWLAQADIMCQFDHVVFMGDLNYRLDYGNQGEEKTPSKELFDSMVSKINDKKYEQLFACDQLAEEMKRGKVFCGFKEGKYNFPPTFKVS